MIAYDPGARSILQDLDSPVSGGEIDHGAAAADSAFESVLGPVTAADGDVEVGGDVGVRGVRAEAGAGVVGEPDGDAGVGCSGADLDRRVGGDLDVAVAGFGADGGVGAGVGETRVDGSVTRPGGETAAMDFGPDAAVGGLCGGGAGVQEFDAAVGGAGVDRTFGLGGADGAVGGLEVRGAFDAFDADGSVRTGDALEFDALGDADEIAGATAAAPARRLNGPDRDRAARRGEVDLDFVQELLSARVLGAIDFDGVAIPGADVDGAVGVFDGDAPAGRQRVAEVEIFFVAIGGAVAEVDFVATGKPEGREEEGR